MPGLRQTVIYAFRFLHTLIILTLILGFSRLGVYYGRAALTLLALTVLPGILGRFNLTTQFTAFIISVRRQFGVTVFWLALTHYFLVRQFQPPVRLFETLGFTALFLMSFMWLTSNNFSVSHLGRWWKRLHRIVYVIIWLIFLHTALQRFSPWSVLIGIITILEVTSWIYFFLKPKTTTP